MIRLLSSLTLLLVCSSVSFAQTRREMPLIVSQESNQAIIVASDDDSSIKLEICQYETDEGTEGGEVRSDNCTRLTSADISLSNLAAALHELADNSESYGIPSVSDKRNLPFYTGAASTTLLAYLSRKFAHPSVYENHFTSPAMILRLTRVVPPVLAIGAIFALYKTGQFYVQSMTQERAASGFYQNVRGIAEYRPFQVNENDFADIVRRLKEVF